jgi:hypothetical protein
MEVVQTSEVDSKIAPVTVGQRNSNCDVSFKNKLLTMISFCGKKRYEHGGRVKVEIHILFYGDNS